MKLKKILREYSFKGMAGAVNKFCDKFVYNNETPNVKLSIRDIPYGNDAKNKMDVYIPDKEGTFPIVIYIHGGGWTVGDKNSYIGVCKRIAAHGYVVFNVNYRLGPKYTYPCQLQDISDAIYYIYNNGKDYNGDTSKIILGGDSAGAHMSSWYGAAINKEELFQEANITNTIPKESIKGLLLFYGAYNLETICDTGFKVAGFGVGDMVASFIGEMEDINRRKIEVLSPIRHLTKDYPPVFMSSGEVDKIHSQSLEFKKALDELDISNDTLFFAKKDTKEAIHCFMNFHFLDCTKEAMTGSLEFLDRVSKEQTDIVKTINKKTII